METLKNIFLRLTSRKFLLTLAAALVLVANERWAELVVLISGYMGIEGIGDAADRVAAQKTKQVELTTTQQKAQQAVNLAGDDPDDIDFSQVVAGDAGDAPL